MAEKSWEEKYREVAGHNEGLTTSLRTLQTKLDEALQREKDTAESHKAAIAEAVGKALADQANAHAAEVKQLKEQSLVPALRDLQARQAADLAAKHAAELAALHG